VRCDKAAQRPRTSHTCWPALPSKSAGIAGGTIAARERRNLDRVSELLTEPAEIAGFDTSREKSAYRISGAPGLAAHVRLLRNRNQGISRWLVLAIFAGAVVALMMVQFAIH
jgi:hypothetical protein